MFPFIASSVDDKQLERAVPAIAFRTEGNHTSGGAASRSLVCALSHVRSETRNLLFLQCANARRDANRRQRRAARKNAGKDQEFTSGALGSASSVRRSGRDWADRAGELQRMARRAAAQVTRTLVVPRKKPLRAGAEIRSRYGGPGCYAIRPPVATVLTGPSSPQ